MGGAIPKEYIPAVDQGIQGAMLSGVLAGYNVVDVKVTLYDGSYHEVDSSEMAFKIAGSMAFKEAMRKADPVLMEPIMKVTVITPEEYMGDVIGDLNSRRGMILGMDAIPGAQQVNAEVPLSEMFGYATDMRSKTQVPRSVHHGARALRRGAQEHLREDHLRAGQKVRLSVNFHLLFLCFIGTMDLIKPEYLFLQIKGGNPNGKGKIRKNKTPC